MATDGRNSDDWRTAREIYEQQPERVAGDCDHDHCDGEAALTVDGEDLCGPCAVGRVRQ